MASESKDYYRMDAARWNNRTCDLTLEQEAAYLRIVNAIHIHKGMIPMNDRVLAGLFRVSTRKARALVERLIGAGKVYLEGGMIGNDRAISDLEHRGFISEIRAELGAAGGRAKAAKSAALPQFTTNSQPVHDHFTTISTPEVGANPARTDGEPTDKPLKTNEPMLPIANIEEKRREEKYIVEFDLFWDAFPRRVNMPSKDAVRKKFIAALKRVSFDDLMIAVEKYAAHRADQVARNGDGEKQFTKAADSWLHNGHWASWLDGDAPQSKADIQDHNRRVEAEIVAKMGKKPVWMK